jgi:hypothetical protein
MSLFEDNDIYSALLLIIVYVLLLVVFLITYHSFLIAITEYFSPVGT